MLHLEGEACKQARGSKPRKQSQSAKNVLDLARIRSTPSPWWPISTLASRCAVTLASAAVIGSTSGVRGTAVRGIARATSVTPLLSIGIAIGVADVRAIAIHLFLTFVFFHGLALSFFLGIALGFVLRVSVFTFVVRSLFALTLVGSPASGFVVLEGTLMRSWALCRWPFVALVSLLRLRLDWGQLPGRCV